MRQPDEAVLLDMVTFARRIRDRMDSVSLDEFRADEDVSSGAPSRPAASSFLERARVALRQPQLARL